MAKSAAFGVVRLGIAFTVGYVPTGSLAIAGAITLVEPIANTIAHDFFDKGREAPRCQAWQRAGDLRSGSNSRRRPPACGR